MGSTSSLLPGREQHHVPKDPRTQRLSTEVVLWQICTRPPGLIIGHKRWDRRPNWKHLNFNFSRRLVVVEWLSPLIVSCLSYSSCSASLRAELYLCPRLLIGFSRIIGIGSPVIQNLSLASWPLTMEMLGDVLDLISIRKQLMFSWSLWGRHLVHVFVVIVVTSSIYALIGGKTQPVFQAFVSNYPPWCLTHNLHCHG